MRANFIYFICAFATAKAWVSSNVHVDVGYATYQGNRLPIGVDQFLGMRYAAPPLGDLRFRAPQDPLPEKDVIVADSYGPICLPVIQAFIPPNPADEDCLFLDLFRPAGSNTTSKHPVMIWFQGGAFNTNFNANYNGTGIVKASNDNLIVVSINYRVGPFGFLASEDVRKDGTLNVGLHDQRKALSWIQKHIAAFGGDPNHVTMFGTSSGAESVLLQTLAYNGAPTKLFARGIVSDPYVPEVFPVSELEFQYEQLLSSANCTDLDCLRSLSSADLQKANLARPFPGQSTAPLFSYGPCIDAELLHDRVSNLLSNGSFVRVPLLFGSATDPGSLFAPAVNTTAELSGFFLQQFPDVTGEQLQAINRQYSYVPPGQVPGHAPLFERTSTIYGDSTFKCPDTEAAEAFTAAGSPVWIFRQYILDAVNVQEGLGAPHTWENLAVWGPKYAIDYAASPNATSYFPGQPNSAMVPIIQSYWTSFARTGNPNTYKVRQAPIWETFRSGKRLRLQTNNTAMEAFPQQEIDDCKFWRTLQNATHH